MQIPITLYIKNQKLTIDLGEYLRDFAGFVDAIYQETETEEPIMIPEIDVVSEYFSNINEIEYFLSIDWEYDKYAPAFLVWKHLYNEAFDYLKFLKVFKGVYETPALFAERYIEHNCNLKSIPKYVREAIDWNKVWDTHLHNEIHTIKVVNMEYKGEVSIYIYAFFQKPKPKVS